jgi:hypothetical protein
MKVLTSYFSIADYFFIVAVILSSLRKMSMCNFEKKSSTGSVGKANGGDATVSGIFDYLEKASKDW